MERNYDIHTALQFTCRRSSAADNSGLIGLWLDGEKYFADSLPESHDERETTILCDAKRWLDVYFSGREPDFMPPLHPSGSDFRKAVWKLLLEIPYGKTVTYGELAKKLGDTSHVGSGCGRRGRS